MSFDPITRNVLGNQSATDRRARFARALTSALANQPSAAKTFARIIDRTPRAAELLLRGDVAPSFDTLIAACAHLDECWEAFAALCQRDAMPSIEGAAATLDAFAAHLDQDIT